MNFLLEISPSTIASTKEVLSRNAVVNPRDARILEEVVELLVQLDHGQAAVVGRYGDDRIV